jgi:hypothetical protein
LIEWRDNASWNNHYVSSRFSDRENAFEGRSSGSGRLKGETFSPFTTVPVRYRWIENGGSVAKK